MKPKYEHPYFTLQILLDTISAINEQRKQNQLDNSWHEDCCCFGCQSIRIWGNLHRKNQKTAIKSLKKMLLNLPAST